MIVSGFTSLPNYADALKYVTFYVLEQQVKWSLAIYVQERSYKLENGKVTVPESDLGISQLYHT